MENKKAKLEEQLEIATKALNRISNWAVSFEGDVKEILDLCGEEADEALNQIKP